MVKIMNEKLALFGGEKTLKEKKKYTLPCVSEETYPLVEEILRKGEISTSPVTNQLEREFAEYVGTEYALAAPNGTTAIQAALFGAGVMPGDEVIVPSFTFWATVGPVVASNAVPVFADVSLDSHTLTADSIAALITKKTKVILLVHVWGNPCDMDPIISLAKKHKIKVVTDCSHAHGAVYDGTKHGIIGDVAAFSLQGSKTMPGGEGGLLVTDDKEIYERAIALGHYERIKSLGEDSAYFPLRFTGCGYKHRIHPVAAAIALGNLHRLDEINSIRSGNAHRFESLIKNLNYIIEQKCPEKGERSFSYHYMRYDTEKLGGVSIGTFLKALAAEGVACGSCGYGILHKSPLYTGKDGPFGKTGPFDNPHWEGYAPNGNLPNTEILSKSAFLAAPRFEIMNEPDVELYAAAYAKLKDNIAVLLEYDKTNNGEILVGDGRSINLIK